ncbi:MAG: putative diguanylate cyclase [Methanoregulaceae archaeon PtaU1.Bin059]|nr:MAG: putative diguanylate cyclase [Methanoregulaceae archaeon PtaU1.Bin059]
MISVLLVDDEPALLDITQIFLEREGKMSVTLSESAGSALRLLESAQFDIIVSDYEMPGMNGIEFLKSVKGRGLDIPFIIFTGRGREHVAIEALNIGASFYLQKGGDPKSQFAELRNMIMQAVRRKKAEEEVRLNQRRLQAMITLHQMSSSDQMELCTYALESAIDLTGSTMGYLAFLNEQETVLSMYAWSKSALSECRVAEKQLIYPVEKTGLWGEPVRQRRPVITNDYTSPEPAKRGFPEGHVKVSRHLGVPVMDGTRIVMVAGLGNKPLEYGDDDIRQVTHLMGGLWQILKRKRIETELVDSEKRFRSYFELPLVGIAITSPDMRWMNANQKLCEMLGYSLEELKGVKWADITPPEDLEKELEDYRQVMAGEKASHTVKKRYVRKDGRYINVEVSAIPVRRENGEVDYFVALIQDISPLEMAKQELEASNTQMAATLEELRATQDSMNDYCRLLEQEKAALRRSEEKFRTMVETAPSMLIITDLKGSITYASPNIRELTGYTTDELESQALSLVHPDDRDRVIDEVSRAYRDLIGLRNLEFRSQRKNGEVWYASSSLEPLREPQGSIVGFLFQTMDVTSRKEAEGALMRSEEKYRELVETINDIVFSLDSSDVITYASPAVTRILGYRPEEVTGHHFTDYLRPTDIPQVMQGLEVLKKEPRSGPFSVEWQIKTSNGEERWARVSLRTRWDGSKYSGCTGTITDIDEQRRSREDLREREALLAGIFRAAPVGIGIVKDRVFSWVNASVARMTGYSPDEMEGKSARMLYPSDEEFARVGSEKYPPMWETGVGSVESRWVRKDGTLFDVLISSSPLNPGDRTSPIVFTVSDITDQKRIEAAVRAMEKKYRELVDDLPDIIYTADLEGRIRFMNKAGLEAFEVTEEEIIGHPFDQNLHPDDLDAGRAVFWDLLRTGEPAINFECRFVARKGKGRVFPVLNNVSVVRDGEGRIVGTRGIALEITEKKKAEEELRQREERLQMIAEQVPGSLWTTDTDLVFTSSYGAGLADMGISTNQVVGMKVGDFYQNQPGAIEAVSAHTRAIKGESVSYIAHYRDRIYRAHLEPLKGKEGEIVGVLGIAFDITDLEHAKDALMESEYLLRTFINAIPEPACLIDAEGRIISANDAFGTRYSVPDTGTPGMAASAILHVEMDETMRAHVEDVFSSGREARFEMVRGNSVYLVSVYPVRDSAGKVTRAAVFSVDITDQKKAQEVLSLMNKKLSLLSRITRHDAQNRILLLKSYLELMEEQTKDPLLLTYIHKERRGVDALQDLLGFTETYQNVGMKSPSWQDVSAAVRRAAGLQDLHQVTVYLDTNGLEIYADPMLEKVFFALIENSIRYGGELSRITFSLHEDDEGLVLVCEDDGVGIPADQKEAIFSAGVGQNTGYGLFLVREVLSMTGFSIRETGEPGKGARFEIRIPRGSFRYPRSQ